MSRRSMTTGAAALAVAALGLGVQAPRLAADTAASQLPGAAYGGRSSQAHVMSLRLTRDGKRLRTWFAQVDLGVCTSSSYGYSIPLHLAREHTVRVHRDGSFVEHGGGTAHTEAGERLDLALELKGRLGKAGAAGTIRVSAPVTDANGNVVNNCDSGRVRWSLGRGMVYGGATTKATAVSIRVDRDRRRIKTFSADIDFECGSGHRMLTLNHLGIEVRRDGSFSSPGCPACASRSPEAGLRPARAPSAEGSEHIGHPAHTEPSALCAEPTERPRSATAASCAGQPGSADAASPR
jgi:hypothetical protein